MTLPRPVGGEVGDGEVLRLGCGSAVCGELWLQRPHVGKDGTLLQVSNARRRGAGSHTPVPFTSVACSGEGHIFAAADRSGCVYLFNVSANKFALIAREVAAPPASGLSFTHCTPEQLLCSCRSAVHVFSAESHAWVATLDGHRADIQAVKACGKRRLVLTLSADRFIVWESGSWEKRRIFQGFESPSLDAALSTDGRLCAALAGPSRVVLWSVDSATINLELSAACPGLHDPRLTVLALGTRLAVAAGAGGLLAVWHDLGRTAAACFAALPAPAVALQLATWGAGLAGNAAETSDVVYLLLDSGALLVICLRSLRVLLTAEVSDSATVAFCASPGRGDLEACSASGGPLPLLLLATSGGTLDFRNLPAATEMQRRSLRARGGRPQVLRSLSSGGPAASAVERGSHHSLSSSSEASCISLQPLDDAGVPQEEAATYRRRLSGRRLGLAAAVMPPAAAAGSHSSSSSSSAPRSATWCPLAGSRTGSAEMPAAAAAADDDVVRGVLLSCGAFPAACRTELWARILHLPCNPAAFERLQAVGLHPTCHEIKRRHGNHSNETVKRLSIVMSALAHWSPAWASAPYLASLAFPFLKVFRSDPRESFEAVACILLNWFQPWVAELPEPPLSVLARADAMLLAADSGLHARLCMVCQHSAGNDNAMPLAVLWPLLQTLLTEVLAKDLWLQLWDHLVVHWADPELLPAAVVAFLLATRGDIMAMPPQSPHRLEEWLLQPHIVTMPAMLQSMYALRVDDAARRRLAMLPDREVLLFELPQAPPKQPQEQRDVPPKARPMEVILHSARPEDREEGTDFQQPQQQPRPAPQPHLQPRPEQQPHLQEVPPPLPAPPAECALPPAAPPPQRPPRQSAHQVAAQAPSGTTTSDDELAWQSQQLLEDLSKLADACRIRRTVERHPALAERRDTAATATFAAAALDDCNGEGAGGNVDQQLDVVIRRREAELEALWKDFDAEVRELSKDDFLQLRRAGLSLGAQDAATPSGHSIAGNATSSPNGMAVTVAATGP